MYSSPFFAYGCFEDRWPTTQNNQFANGVFQNWSNSKTKRVLSRGWPQSTVEYRVVVVPSRSIFHSLLVTSVIRSVRIEHRNTLDSVSVCVDQVWTDVVLSIPTLLNFTMYSSQTIRVIPYLFGRESRSYTRCQNHIR